MVKDECKDEFKKYWDETMDEIRIKFNEIFNETKKLRKKNIFENLEIEDICPYYWEKLKIN